MRAIRAILIAATLVGTTATAPAALYEFTAAADFWRQFEWVKFIVRR